MPNLRFDVSIIGIFLFLPFHLRIPPLYYAFLQYPFRSWSPARPQLAPSMV